jgi:hypothetical protein
VETGAVTGVHRAGASLNVHVHFHVLCLDGVYVEGGDGGALRFEAAPAPTLEELEEWLKYIYARVVKWLGSRGLLRDVDASNEAPTYSAGGALTLAGMQRGTLETAKESGEPAEPELSGAPPRVRDAAVHERFNLHASVPLAAHDDLGRERLCRYLTRPAFSLARFGVSSRRPRRLSGEESRSRPSEAARDDSAFVPWSPCGHGRRRVTRFFGCAECLGRATHGERGRCLAHLNRM